MGVGNPMGIGFSSWESHSPGNSHLAYDRNGMGMGIKQQEWAYHIFHVCKISRVIVNQDTISVLK